MNHFSMGLWHATKSRRSSKALPKAKLAPKNRSWSLFGCLLLVWSTTAFWIPAKPFHLRSISANQWDALKTATPAASIGQQKGLNSSPQCPIARHTTNASKVERTGLESFASSTIPDLSPTNYNSFKHLTTVCRESVSTTSRRQKMLSKSSWNPEAWIFTLHE